MPLAEMNDAASRFGRNSYPHCSLHASEAASVYQTLMRARRLDLADLCLDTTVADLFDRPGVLHSRPSDLDPLVAAAKLVERAALRHGMPLGESDVRRVLWSGDLFQDLLGSASRQSPWEPTTVWLRSIRGIVNERIRWGKAGQPCTCP